MDSFALSVDNARCSIHEIKSRNLNPALLIEDCNENGSHVNAILCVAGVFRTVRAPIYVLRGGSGGYFN